MRNELRVVLVDDNHVSEDLAEVREILLSNRRGDSLVDFDNVVKAFDNERLHEVAVVLLGTAQNHRPVVVAVGEQHVGEILLSLRICC